MVIPSQPCNDSNVTSAPSVQPHGGSVVNLDNFATNVVLASSLAAAAVIAAPLALPALGIGQESEAKLLRLCCDRIEEHTGITETITQLIEKIPVVGTYLNLASPETSLMTKILVPGSTILGGTLAGTLVQNYEKEQGGSGIIGTAIKLTSMAVGVVLSLPVLLPGIAHGAMFLGEVTGAKGIGTLIAQDIGTNYCAVKGPNPVEGEVITKAYSAVTGSEVSAGMLLGHVGCFLPALVTLAPATGHVAAEKLKDRLHEGIPTPQVTVSKTMTHLYPGQAFS